MNEKRELRRVKKEVKKGVRGEGKRKREGPEGMVRWRE